MDRTLIGSPVAEGCSGILCIMLGFASHVMGGLGALFGFIPWSAVPVIIGSLIGVHTLWRISVRCIRQWSKYGWRALTMSDIE